jgi:Uma2 family endonuclease
MTLRAPTAEAAVRDGRFGQLLYSGDRLDRRTFHALYLLTPEGFKAELIGGVVYVASPVSFRHGRPHAVLCGWLALYSEATPHTDVLDNTTNILGEEDSEPQPDLMMRIDPVAGGQTRDSKDEYVVGPAELVVEVANSSAAIDLNAKFNDYQRYGVREYLVADAQRERVRWFARRGGKFAELKPDADGLLKSRTFPGLWLDPAAVFDRTSRRLTAALRLGLATPEHAAFVAKLEAKAARRPSKSPPAPEAE